MSGSLSPVKVIMAEEVGRENVRKVLLLTATEEDSLAVNAICEDVRHCREHQSQKVILLGKKPLNESIRYVSSRK